MLDSLTAPRFDRRMTRGRTAPFLLEGDTIAGDAVEVVAKFTSPQLTAEGLVRAAGGQCVHRGHGWGHDQVATSANPHERWLSARLGSDDRTCEPVLWRLMTPRKTLIFLVKFKGFCFCSSHA